MTTAVATAPETVELRCFYASGMYVLTPSEDSYDGMGRRAKGRRGDIIRFTRGVATVPVEWMPMVEAMPGWGTEVFLADDVRAPKAVTGPRVTDGSVTAADRTKPGPPLTGWNTTGPRELRERIVAGEVRDPVAALTYEAQGKRREQVMTALSQRIARGKPDPDPEPEAAAEPQGFEAELPAEAKGV